MKCNICGNIASIKLDYANLRLCNLHFVNYFKRRIKRTIEKYKLINPGDKILIAVSGGKDSLTLLNILSELREDINFYLEGITIDLGIEEYSNKYIKIVKENYEKFKVEYKIISLKDELGFTISEIIKSMKRRRPCSICGAIKRYMLNKLAYEWGFNKLATGHNLDDLLYILLRSYIRGDYKQALKLYPLLPGNDRLVTRIRPLAEIPESDIILYSRIKGINFLKEKCPYSKGSKGFTYRKLLDMLEQESPSSKLSMLRSFYNIYKPALESYYLKRPIKLKYCKSCGMPTSNEICSVCKIIARVQRR